MTDHDQNVCLRCSEPAGDHGFCESCRSVLDGSAGLVAQAGGHAGASVYAAAPPAGEIRLEQTGIATEGGGDQDTREGAATVRIDASARQSGDVPEDARPGAVKFENVATTGGEHLSKSSPRPREVGRFEELLTPASAPADYRQADAAGSPEGSTNLGVWLEENGDIEGALAAYRRAGERGYVDGMFNLGCLLAEVGDVAGALSAFQRADDRGDPGGASNLGVLLERQGDVEGALAAYRRADKRGDAVGAFNLGRLLAGRGELADAKAAYRRAAKRGDLDVRAQAAAAEANLVKPSGAPRGAQPDPDATAAPTSATPPERPSAAAPSERPSATTPPERPSVAPPEPRRDETNSLLGPGPGVAPRSPWPAVMWGLALLGVFVLLVRRRRRRR